MHAGVLLSSDSGILTEIDNVYNLVIRQSEIRGAQAMPDRIAVDVMFY